MSINLFPSPPLEARQVINDEYYLLHSPLLLSMGAGAREVKSCKEMIEGLSIVAYRRVSATLVVGASASGHPRQAIEINRPGTAKPQSGWTSSSLPEYSYRHERSSRQAQLTFNLSDSSACRVACAESDEASRCPSLNFSRME
jgi:hypothetical protein